MASIIHPEVKRTADRYLKIVLLDTVMAGLFYLVITLQEGIEADPKQVFETLTLIMLWSAFWELFTGVFADIFTRRAATVSSFFLTAVAGIFLWLYSMDFLTTFSVQAYLSLYALGAALMSGALEAWLYDRTAYYGPSNEPDLADTFRSEMVRTIFGTATGYAVGLLVLLALVYIMGGNSPHTKDLAYYTAICLMGVAVYGIYLSWQMSEEYWIREEHHHKKGLLGYVVGMLTTLFLEKLRYGTFVALYSVAYAVDMLFTFTVWPLLLLSTETSEGGVIDEKNFLILAFVFIATSSIGAYTTRFLQGRLSLLRVSEAEVRPMQLCLAYAWNFLPMVVIGFATLEYPGRGPGLIILLVVAILVYRFGLVIRQGIFKAVLQRTVVESSHRAALVSLATAVGSITAAVSAWAYIYYVNPVYSAKGSLNSVLARAWILAPLGGLLLVFLLSQVCKSWLSRGQNAESGTVDSGGE